MDAVGDAMTKYRVILADDHRLVRQGLTRILAQRADLEVVGEVGDGIALLKALPRLNPDLVILDLSMPNLRGMEAIPEIKRNRPDLKVLVLTMHRDQEYLNQAIAAGANGYLLKEDADKDLFFAIDVVLAGRIYVSKFLAEQSRSDWVALRRGGDPGAAVDPLTVREREVLKLIAEGKSSKEIGTLLQISGRTVERHRANILDKLNVRSTVDLVRYAVGKGYV